MAVVHSVCISERKGERKKAVPSIELVEDFGVKGDAHAGSGRQVSLLAYEGLLRMREKLDTIMPGDFAENLNVRGLNELGLVVGSRIRVGESALLEVTQLGKKCHDAGCAIMRAVGTCVMPKEGVFAKVLRGGVVLPGDAVTLSPTMDE